MGMRIAGKNAAIATLRARPRSVRQKQRKFQQTAKCLEKFCAGRAIDDAMVTTHRDTQPATYHDIATDDHRFWLNAADREDAALRRIDDRREVIDAEHAEIRDGECGPRVLFRLEFPLTR